MHGHTCFRREAATKIACRATQRRETKSAQVQAFRAPSMQSIPNSRVFWHAFSAGNCEPATSQRVKTRKPLGPVAPNSSTLQRLFVPSRHSRAIVPSISDRGFFPWNDGQIKSGEHDCANSANSIFFASNLHWHQLRPRRHLVPFLPSGPPGGDGNRRPQPTSDGHEGFSLSRFWLGKCGRTVFH